MGFAWIGHALSFRGEAFKVRDSTREGPGEPVGGVLFHPPYFGAARQSGSDAEISAIESLDEYEKALRKTVGFVRMCLVRGGLVCAVGRDYRHRESRIRLDMLYLEMFREMGASLVQVWVSEPDVVLLFRKET